MKILILALVFLSQVAWAESKKSVLIVLNDAFQPAEYFEPRKIFEESGFEIKTASRFGVKAHPGKKNVEIKSVDVDYSYEQIIVEDYNAIIFVGGGGSWSDFFPNKTLHEVLVKAMNQKGMVVGLICAGTGLLATAKNFNGKSPQFVGRKVTGYSEVEALLILVGKLDYSAGDLSKPYVVTDGNLVTGRDPLSAELFGETVAQKILNQ